MDLVVKWVFRWSQDIVDDIMLGEREKFIFKEIEC